MMLLQNPSKYRKKKKQAVHHRSGAKGLQTIGKSVQEVPVKEAGVTWLCVRFICPEAVVETSR